MWIIDFIQAIGYLGIAILMFLETYIILIQSEIVMSFSGFTSQQGKLNIWIVIAAGVIGSEIGAISLFLISRRFREERVLQWISKYGKFIGIKRSEIDSVNGLFRRNQRLAVFVGRMVPGLRSAIAIPAGIQKMPLKEFALFNLFGTIFWVSLLAGLGYYLSEQYALVARYGSYITYSLLGLLLVSIIYRFISYRTS